MTTNLPKRRRWLQFRLRTLLIAVVVLSLPLSWFAVRMEKARRQREAIAAIERLGGVVERWEDLSVPKWIRKFFPDEFFIYAVEVVLDDTEATDACLEHLKGMTNIDILQLNGTKVTDACLEHLEGLTNLGFLRLKNTNVTPEGVKKLQEALPNCDIMY